MTQLKEIIKEFKKELEITKTPLDNVPATAYAGRKGKVRRAKENILLLKERYLNSVRSSSIFILNVGENKEEFTNIAKEEFGCFCLDSDQMFHELVSDLDEQLFKGKQVSAAIFDIVGRKIEDVALDMGIQSYPFMNFEGKYKVKVNTREELMKVVRRGVCDKIGGELVGLYSTYKVAQQALDELYDAKIVPIVLSVDEDRVLELAKDLNFIFRNVFIVNNGVQDEKIANKSIAALDKVNKTNIQKTLKEIKKNVVL